MWCANEWERDQCGESGSARHVHLCKTAPYGLLHRDGQNGYDIIVLVWASFPRRPFAPPLRGGAHTDPNYGNPVTKTEISLAKHSFTVAVWGSFQGVPSRNP
jgi:hypothetical protein